MKHAIRFSFLEMLYQNKEIYSIFSFPILFIINVWFAKLFFQYLLWRLYDLFFKILWMYDLIDFQIINLKWTYPGHGVLYILYSCRFC